MPKIAEKWYFNNFWTTNAIDLNFSQVIHIIEAIWIATRNRGYDVIIFIMTLWRYMSFLAFRNILWRRKGVLMKNNKNPEKCLLEKSFTFNLVKTERKKVISFKGYLDFSETHDFREMTICIFHVMTSSKMLTSAKKMYIWTHIKWG